LGSGADSHATTDAPNDASPITDRSTTALTVVGLFMAFSQSESAARPIARTSDTYRPHSRTTHIEQSVCRQRIRCDTEIH